MSEHDDTLARWFAEDDPNADRDAFAAAVRRRVAARRRWVTAGRIGLNVAIAVAAAVVIALVPESLLNPLLLLDRIVSPELTFAAGIVTAAGLAWWSRFADAG